MFLLRIIGHLMPLMQPLEEMICLDFIPSLTGHIHPTYEERDFLALPARFGHLGLFNPNTSTHVYANSKQLSSPLSSLILQQSTDMDRANHDQLALKTTLLAEIVQHLKEAADVLESHLPVHLQCMVELACEGASDWVTTLSITSHGVSLHKSFQGCYLHSLWLDTCKFSNHVLVVQIFV